MSGNEERERSGGGGRTPALSPAMEITPVGTAAGGGEGVSFTRVESLTIRSSHPDNHSFPFHFFKIFFA